MSEVARNPDGTPRSWEAFSADPRKAKNVELRASDRDRTLVATILGDAYAEGRLNVDEHQERLDKALNVRTLGEITPLVQDVWLTGRPTTRSVAPRSSMQRGVDTVIGAGIGSWLLVAVITNVIWLATSLSAGHLNYYWPMWPMIGVGIGVIATLSSRAKANAQRRLANDDRGPRELGS